MEQESQGSHLSEQWGCLGQGGSPCISQVPFFHSLLQTLPSNLQVPLLALGMLVYQ